MNGLICMDVDGVLVDFESASYQHFGECDRTIYSMNERYPHLSQVEIDAFVCDPKVYAALSPISGAARMCHRLSENGAILTYVSARPANLFSTTQEWLNKHGFPVGQLYLCYWEDKARFIQSIEPSIAVDDSPEVIRMLKDAGIVTFIFDQPWNRSLKGLRIGNWEGVFHA